MISRTAKQLRYMMKIRPLAYACLALSTNKNKIKQSFGCKSKTCSAIMLMSFELGMPSNGNNGRRGRRNAECIFPGEKEKLQKTLKMKIQQKRLKEYGFL